MLESIFLSISSGQGPEECAHAAALTLQILLREIDDRRAGGEAMRAALIETEDSRIKGNIHSALLLIEGEGVGVFADSWTGVIQWIWRSEYRPHHRRKNWFVSVKPFSPLENENAFNVADVRFEIARASGHGGQKVNKTETAVRAVHIPSGKTAVSRDERSQLMNKKIALARLASLFGREEAEKKDRDRARLRHIHYELERGSPIRIYDGETLQRKDHERTK
jgi:peptide chain release factor